MFDDEFLDKEDNNKVWYGMMRFLTQGADIQDNPGREDNAITEYHRTPDTSQLSENLRSCLQESKPLPKDFT